MKRLLVPLLARLASLSALALALPQPSTSAATSSQARQSLPAPSLALTFDDLPYVNPGGTNYRANATRVTTELLAVLKAHRAPAVGFVNEDKLADAGGDFHLRQWADAGMVLGNHTYSHPDFNRRTVEEFQSEIARGDRITRRVMEGRGPYQLYFRHPMTHTGSTRDRKEQVNAFLSARGYRVAPHTIENADYLFNAVYARARVREDTAQMTRVHEAYLAHTFAATDFAERITPEIFGRAVPQVLLIHANDLNADALDEMLDRFESRGYRFITLDEAMRDEAYRTPDTYVGASGPTWLFRWSRSLGQTISFKDDPEPPAWVTSRSDR